ncbi:unnamed protein product [Brassica rapa subsp. trilocularis]
MRYKDCGGKFKESFKFFSSIVMAIIQLKDIDRDIRKALSRLVIVRAIFELKDMGQRHKDDIHNDMYPTFLQ